MQILNRQEIEKHCAFEALHRAIEQSYIAVSDGKATIPPVGYLPIEGKDADCNIKFGHLHGDAIFLVKIATGFYDNPKYGLPSSNGMMVAVSAQTGEMVAILQDEGLLTDLRTAIGAAIASKALARQNAKHILVVGAGIQAEQQILAHDKLLADRDLVFSIWARDAAKADALASKLADQDIGVSTYSDLKEAVSAAQIVLTTTPSREPLIMSDWVQPGTHITATGADAPGKCELDPQLVARAQVLIADKIDQCADHGEFSSAVQSGLVSKVNLLELGKVLAGSGLGRQSDDQVSIADLTGLASQDIAAARTVLEKAGII